MGIDSEKSKDCQDQLFKKYDQRTFLRRSLKEERKQEDGEGH